MSGSRWFLIGILAGLILVTAVGVFGWSLSGVESRANPPFNEEEESGPTTSLPGKRQTILVMGADERPGDPGRADTIMLLSWNPSANQVGVLSLPRDLWVQIPNHGYDKLNHSFAYGGEKLVVSTVQRLLGLTIDHYVVVNFRGFGRIVDSLGGVEINVEKRLYYEDPYDADGGLVIDLHPGLQQLDGTRALHYARFRMDEEGDIGRMKRQQTLLKALAAEAMRPSNVGRLPALIRGLFDAVRTDLSVTEVVRLGVQGTGALKAPMVTGSINGEGGYIDGVFYLAPDLLEARTRAYQLLTGEEPDATFTARAREANMTYSAAWRRALEESAARASVPPAGADGDDPETESPPGTDQGEGQDQDEEGTPPAGTRPPGQQPEPPPPPGGATAPKPITVALIDASGKNLAAEYAGILREAGFRVNRISTAPTVLTRTVVLDHSGNPEQADRLRMVLPNAQFAPTSNQEADAVFEVVLGADLRD